MFTTSVLKESRASAYYWWCLLTMVGMVNMMIIYIEKTIPKALDIKNII